jgi:hypothetical protein
MSKKILILWALAAAATVAIMSTAKWEFKQVARKKGT